MIHDSIVEESIEAPWDFWRLDLIWTECALYAVYKIYFCKVIYYCDVMRFVGWSCLFQNHIADCIVCLCMCYQIQIIKSAHTHLIICNYCWLHLESRGEFGFYLFNFYVCHVSPFDETFMIPIWWARTDYHWAWSVKYFLLVSVTGTTRKVFSYCFAF